jgi:hypothetical protein
MPEPGYNEGESPPLWVWVVGLTVILIVVAIFQSCS